MNWPLMIVAMLPEHLLLAGIVVLLGLNIMQVGERHSGLVAFVAVAAAALIAALLAHRSVRRIAVSRPLLGRSRGRWPPRRWCWRWRCR